MAEIIVKLVDGELAGKTAQQITKEISAATLATKKATIGTQEWVDAHARLDKAVQNQANLKAQIASTTSASDSLKKSFGGILNQIPGFSQLSGVLGQAKGGVGGLTSGFGLLRGAIIATGIGALVIAIVGLVSWFSKTEKGANMISGAFKAMGNVIDTLMSRLWNIGSTLKQLFSDPIQFFKDLGNDIADAAVEGYDLVQVFDDIEDRQRDLEVRSKEQEIQIDKMLLQAKNVAKSYEERIAILAKADEMTRATYKTQLALSKEYLDAVEKEIAGEMKRQGVADMTDDQADKLKEAKLAYLNLIQEEVNMEEKIQNRRDQIIGKQEKANDKANAAKEKQNEKEQKDLESSLDKLEDLRIKAIKDAEAQEIAAINLKYDRELEASTLQGEQRTEMEKLIEENKQQEIAVIKDKYAAAALVKEKKVFDEQLKQIDTALDEQSNLLTQRFLTKQITEQQYAEMTAQAVLASEQEKLNLIRAAHGEQSTEYQKAYTSFLNHQKAYSDESAKTTQELARKQMQAVVGSLQVTAGFMGSMAGLYEQGTAQYKAFATAQAVISTIEGGINAYTSALKIPYVGQVLAPIAAAAALASGYAQVNRIRNTKVASPVKAERGRVLRGPSHALGGIPVEAEGDEIIMTKGVYRNPQLRQMASDINVAAGGISFSSPVSPFQDRPPVGRYAAGGNVSSGGGDMAEMRQWFSAMIEAQDKRIDRIQVVNYALKTDRTGYQDQVDVLNQIKDRVNV
jgi:hypothetical protein